MRRNCRRLERRYRLSLSPDDRRLWVEATRKRFQAYSVKEGRVLAGSSAAVQPFIESHLAVAVICSRRDRDVSGTTGYSADQFAAFFLRRSTKS